MVSLIPGPRDAKRRDAASSTSQPRARPDTKTKASKAPSADAPRTSSKVAATRPQALGANVPSHDDQLHTMVYMANAHAPVSPHGPLLQYKHADVSTSNVLRHKRPLISDFVKQRRESPPESGPGSLSIQIPEATATVQPSQSRSLPPTNKAASPIRSPSRSIRPREIPEDLRHVFHAPTPLSELSATPSLRNDSPSIFSQISPSSTTTPTSTCGYSPKVSHNPHFGPGYSTTSPPRKTEVRGTQLTSLNLSQAAQRATQVQGQKVPSLSRAGGTTPSVQTSTSPTGLDQRVATAGGPRQAKGSNSGRRQDALTMQGVPAVIPELAHLEDSVAMPAVSPSKAPGRPSRDGIEGLYGLPSPVSPPLAGNDRNTKRRSGSVEPRLGADGSETQNAVGQDAVRRLATSQPSQPLARTRLSIRPPEKPRLIDTTVSPASASTQSRSASTPLSASSTRSASRFGFLFRRDKTASPVSEIEAAAQVKKGPVAGTGHEGYGRVAGKRRSTGGSSNRRISGGSTSSAGIDEFLASKAAPVYIRKNDDGQLIHSDRSSSAFTGNRMSQQSSVWSAATSQSGISAPVLDARALTSSPTDVRAPQATEISRPSSSRGRGSLITTFARPRKLSKDPKRGPSAEPVLREPTPAMSRNVSRDRNLSDAGDGKKPGLLSRFGFSRHKAPSHDGPKAKVNATAGPSRQVLEIAQQLAASKARAHYELPDLEDLTTSQTRLLPMEEIGHILEEAVLTDGDGQTEIDPRDGKMPLRETQPVASQSRVESAEVNFTLSPELQHQRSTKLGRGVADNHKTADTDIRRTFSTNVAQYRRNAPNYSRLMNKPQVTPADASAGALLASKHTPMQSPARHSRHVSLDSSIGSDVIRASQVQILGTEIKPQQLASSSRPSSGFLTMPPRKGSEASVSSSASSFYQPVLAATAVSRMPGGASSPDEVWHEYDEFIRHLTPTNSNQSQDGARPTQHTGYFDRKPQPVVERMKTKSNTTFPRLGEMAVSLRSDLSPFRGKEKRSPHFSGLVHPAVWDTPISPPSSILPSPPTESSRPSPLSVKADPMVNLKRRTSTKAAKENVTRRGAGINDARLSSLAPDFCKMLTFGKALFSPAHEDLEGITGDAGAQPKQRVLVFDGLGKDWSQSCAHRYPRAHVVVHSPGPLDLSPSVRPSSPRNHRHVRHSDLAVKLPYPPSSFHTVVFRFPLATSEFSLGFAISECKRVLRPGGFLEICLLDLDLTVMGDKTRRAIRGLKTRIQQTQPDVSLKPTSDYVQYLLGRHGFEDLHRCTLLPPVASPITTSPRGSLDETGRPRKPSLGRDDLGQLGLLAPHIGRWLYSQAFEQKALAMRPGQSIWKDPELLAECEEKNAAFKLLVCYAQRPESDKRKTQSL